MELFLPGAEKKYIRCNWHCTPAKQEPDIPISPMKNFLQRDSCMSCNNFPSNVLRAGYEDMRLINFARRYLFLFDCIPRVPVLYLFQYVRPERKIFCYTSLRPYNKIREAWAHFFQIHKRRGTNRYVPEE